MKFQIRSLGYTDPGMKGDMKRMLRRVPGGQSWMSAAILFARILGFGLGILFLGMAAIVSISTVLEPDSVGENWWVPLVLWGLTAVYLLLALMLRPLPDPIRDRLWPPETAAVIVTCEEDVMQVSDGRMVIRLQYRDLYGAEETPNCFYLFPTKGHFLMLRKRDFVQGEPADFGTFLAERMGSREGGL